MYPPPRNRRADKMDCFKDFMTNVVMVRSGNCLRERVWKASGRERLSVVLFRCNKKVYLGQFSGSPPSLRSLDLVWSLLVKCRTPVPSISTDGGTRTRTLLRITDFKSVASTIPPRRLVHACIQQRLPHQERLQLVDDQIESFAVGATGDYEKRTKRHQKEPNCHQPRRNISRW